MTAEFQDTDLIPFQPVSNLVICRARVH